MQFFSPLATVKCRQHKLKTKQTTLNCLKDKEQNNSCLVKGALLFKIIKLVNFFNIIRKHSQSEDRLQLPKELGRQLHEYVGDEVVTRKYSHKR